MSKPDKGQPTDALSPLDGRYAGKLAALREVFSEAGLMRERVRVECAWFLALAEGPAEATLRDLPAAAGVWAQSLASDPAPTDVAAIKSIEARTKHDVKAVEYWIRGELKLRGARAAQLEWVHFACTSEDINNLAYALMLERARDSIVLPALEAIGSFARCARRSAMRPWACWPARTGRRRRRPPSARSLRMSPRGSSASARVSRGSRFSAR